MTPKPVSKLFVNPSLPPLPPQVLKNIETGKYIELGNLLPEALSESIDKNLQDRKEESTTASKQKFPIDTPLNWVLASSTYSAVATHYHPDKVAQLIAYTNIILCLAREVKGNIWSRYDRAFRQMAAIHPSIRWDCWEPNVWLAAMSEDNCNRASPSTESTMVARPAVTSKSVANQHKQLGDDICQWFNHGECFSKTCDLSHKCLICWSQSHGANNRYILKLTRCKFSAPTLVKEAAKKDNTA